jgi:TPR repeat protein
MWIVDIIIAHGMPRKPLKTPPISPNVPSWDNPYPTLPGAKKKSSVDEEQAILQQMAAMEVGGPPQGRPRGGKAGKGYAPRNVPVDDFGRPSMEGRRPAPDDYERRSTESSRRAPPDNYGRQSSDSQRPMPPRNYPPQQQGPPQQGYPDPRRGQQAGYQQQPPNTYNEPGYDDRSGYASRNGPASPGFSAPGRSMTMGSEPQMPSQGRQPPMGAAMDGIGPSAPYNGPVGRQMAPRPATAGSQRPLPQRNYGQQPPISQDPYGAGRGQPPSLNTYQSDHQYAQQDYSASSDAPYDDFFDAYYDSPEGNVPQPSNGRHPSADSGLPNFDAIQTRPGTHKRGASIDEHIQSQPGAPPNGYTPQLKPIKSQPDFRGQVEPQAAVFEMAAAPPMPIAPIPQAYDRGYGPQGGYGGSQNGPYDRNSDPAYQHQYSEPPPPQNSFVPPPRSASAAPRAGQPGYAGGLPSGPRTGMGGFSNGPSQQSVPLRANTMNNMPPPRQALSPDALPSHPPPVRAGLMPNSVASLASNKPTPVRNYGGVASPPQQANPQQLPPQQQIQPAPVQSMPSAPAPALASNRPLSSAPVTAEELERLRQIVKGNPNDQASALQLARKLIDASDTLVQTIPDQRTRNKTREKYVMDAHKILKKLVQAQNTDAMFFLADSHGRGALGLEPDNKEAFTLYQSAAKAGHAAAAYRTAVCCELGNDEGGGTRKDPSKAIQWYKRAATLGDTPAMYKMGMILLKGLLNQPKNPREAIGWLKRAAERADAENPHALHELGLLFEAPQSAESSVVRDEAYSFSLFQQAANLGYKYSQYRLGCAYEYGLFGCPVDPRQSIMWYSRAAAQEEHQSELSLSGWYLTGMEGVLQQSDTEAYLWARKAAMAGLAKAEYAMGYFTEVGIGSPANLEDAKRWYWRAAGMLSFSLVVYRGCWVRGVC